MSEGQTLQDRQDVIDLHRFVKHPTLAAAVRAVMVEVAYVQKKIMVDNKYSAVAEADVIAAIRPAMIRHGLIGPLPIGCPHVEVTDRQTSTGKPTRHCLVVRQFEFRHVDSEQSMMVEVPGEANDSGDKAINKALTIAKKYALREFFCLETGSDPDYVASERGSENEPEFRRAATAIEGAPSAQAVQKVLDAMDRRPDMFDGEQLEKLRAAADRKIRSFPGSQPKKD